MPRSKKGNTSGTTSTTTPPTPGDTPSNIPGVSKEFLSMFKGRIAIEGKELSWKMTFDWLASLPSDKRRIQSIFACIQFYKQPPRFLSDGITRKGMDDKKGKLDAQLVQFVPTHTNEFYEAEKSKFKREDLFALVNYSMVERIALMAHEIYDVSWIATSGYCSLFGNNIPSAITQEDVMRRFSVSHIPTEQVKDTSTDEGKALESARITWESFKNFQDQRVYWRAFSWEDVMPEIPSR